MIDYRSKRPLPKWCGERAELEPQLREVTRTVRTGRARERKPRSGREVSGWVVVAAECPDGIEPLETVRTAIFRIGVAPRLPRDVRLELVSSVHRDQVARMHVSFGAEIDIGQTNCVLASPRASQLPCEADGPS